MGFNNPSVPWSELEKQLSGRHSPKPARPPVGEWANGGDSPAWSHHRPTYEAPPDLLRRTGTTPYAELHCHSNFSFLDGASHPEELAEAASAVGLPTAFGAELAVLAEGGAGTAHHALVLARDPTGYAALARTISQAQMAGEKGAPRLTAAQLADAAAGAEGHWLALTGCRQGA